MRWRPHSAAAVLVTVVSAGVSLATLSWATLSPSAVVAVAAQSGTRTAAAPTAQGQIAGRVVRPDGLPQPDAQVVLARRTERGTLVQLPWRATTAFDGRYEITRVPVGRYLVMVRPIGGDTALAGRPDATLFPGVPVNEAGSPVEVLAGLSAEGIDIWLVPSPRRFSVSGRVFGPDGNTFDSLAIELGRPGVKATDVAIVADPGGVFLVEAVPPGTLVLRARATRGERVLTGLVTTTVAAGSVEDVRIVVADLVAVAGRLRAGGGVLPRGLTVTLVSQVLPPTALYAADPVEVSPDGSFQLQAEPGAHTVFVSGLPPGWSVRGVVAARAGDAGSVLVSRSSAAPLDVLVGPDR